MPYRNGRGPMGPGAGMGGGGGMGFGRGRFAYTGTRCQRFPWLPRFWWNSGAEIPDQMPYGEPSPVDEKAYLKEETAAIKEELKAIEDRMAELNKKK